VNDSLHWQLNNEPLPASDPLFSGQLIAVRAPSTGWYVLAGEGGHVPDMSVILPTPQGQVILSGYKWVKYPSEFTPSTFDDGLTATTNTESCGDVE
jgi:hypothetical protein